MGLEGGSGVGAWGLGARRDDRGKGCGWVRWVGGRQSSALACRVAEPDPPSARARCVCPTRPVPVAFARPGPCQLRLPLPHRGRTGTRSRRRARAAAVRARSRARSRATAAAWFPLRAPPSCPRRAARSRSALTDPLQLRGIRDYVRSPAGCVRHGTARQAPTLMVRPVCRSVSSSWRRRSTSVEYVIRRLASSRPVCCKALSMPAICSVRWPEHGRAPRNPRNRAGVRALLCTP